MTYQELSNELVSSLVVLVAAIESGNLKFTVEAFFKARMDLIRLGYEEELAIGRSEIAKAIFCYHRDMESN